jgi:hypothetical protein
MNNNVEDKNLEELEEAPVISLTDEETGEEMEFTLLARAEMDGKLYFALEPNVEESEEYVILRVTEDGDDLLFESIEDDDEFDKMADYFDDLLFNEVDYDA